MKRRLLYIATILLLVFFMTNCGKEKLNVNFVGVRSSSYGIMPFPGPSGWRNAIESINKSFDGATPFAVWIVGETGPTNEICQLQFPSEGVEYENILFSNTDKHEQYLDYFDKHGIKVFLQVEPCSADIFVLMDLVLNRYGHHESVIGFGLDNEWYQQAKAEKLGMDPGFGYKTLDEDAEAWEKKVKSFNKDYRLFLKHWDKNWMPPNYRGDIIFVNDTQEVSSLKGIMYEYKDWADAFYPNDIVLQTGYLSDKRWWEKLSNPPLEIAKAARKYGIENENIGICWVDFTLRDVAPTESLGDDTYSSDEKDNLALGKKTVSSEIETEGYEADKAVDGNPSTRWSSKDLDPSWMYIDLGKKYDIGKVMLIWETSYSSEYEIQVSNNAKDWETVYHTTNNMGDIENIELDDVNARYVKLFGIKRKFDLPDYGHSLWEMKVFEKK